jgi:molybdopterin synthase catalytic subunit
VGRVALAAAAFDPYADLRDFQRRHGLDRGAVGATAVFVGTMRDFNDGEAVEELFLEHYPGMTERCLEEIVASALADTGASDARVVHRVGSVVPGEDIVLVAAFSAHRAEAFAACRAIIEALKRDAPFWKRERGPGGERWVQCSGGVSTTDG